MATSNELKPIKITELESNKEVKMNEGEEGRLAEPLFGGPHPKANNAKKISTSFHGLRRKGERPTPHLSISSSSSSEELGVVIFPTLQRTGLGNQIADGPAEKITMRRTGLGKTSFGIMLACFLLCLRTLLSLQNVYQQSSVSSYLANPSILAMISIVTREYGSETRRQKKRKPSDPLNMHENHSIVCSKDSWKHDNIHPSVAAFFDLVYHPQQRRRNYVGHRSFAGPVENGIRLLWNLQSCQYAALEKWWELARQYGIERWSAHGGAAMAAHCYHSMNLWDDDIDITVSSCHQLEEIYSQATEVDETYPDLPLSQYWVQNWKGKLLHDKQWILIKGPRQYPWYKLKSVQQALEMPHHDLAGMDIMCFPAGISRPEQVPMRTSGFSSALVNESFQLQQINFGPTQIKLVPDHILFSYIKTRYGKDRFCDFPFDHGKARNVSTARSIRTETPRTLQIEEAMAKWYITSQQRDKWLKLAGKEDGNKLSHTQIPNLDTVEIDNTIAPESNCQPYENRTIRFVNWNAERGKYWAEFAEMIPKRVALLEPDVIILNEMDIGMARSGNLHTTRQLAYALGMNYAWGLEFVELTRGSHDEQNATEGQRNALGLHGNAILSKCKLYDAKVFRDDLDPGFFKNGTSRVNAKGSEIRLGGRMGLFARTGLGTDSFKELTVGSVHKLDPNTHREAIWKYFGFGDAPEKAAQIGALPESVAGIVASGDLASRAFCTASGLQNLDKPQKHKTFPASCADKREGSWRGDQFCGLMDIVFEDKVILPCYNASDGRELQISDHSIIQIDLKKPKRMLESQLIRKD